MFAQSVDSLPPMLDSLRLVADSLKPAANNLGVRLSKEGLDAKVEYGARDSQFFDVKNRMVYLYGGAYVRYKDLSLAAGYIMIDLRNNVATAEPLKDSAGVEQGRPTFVQADQNFVADKLQYNFRTRKGLIFDVTSTQGDLYVHGAKTKMIGHDPADTTAFDVIFSEDALITTCNLDHPHYGIRSSKQKVIPNKLIVLGPSHLEIADVPTPLVLPFGFYPVTTTKRQGIILPKDFDFDPKYGFGIENMGYYLPISDNLDVTLNGGVYWNGSWMLGAKGGYNTRYRYNGAVDLGFSRLLTENEQAKLVGNNSFKIAFRHSQDQRAHPTFSFNASVNIQTNNFDRRNNNDARSVLNQQLTSNANFTKIFPDKPFSLNGGLTHSQNIQTNEMSVQFPTLNFQMQQIFPFKRKERIGKEQWYEKISFRYNSSFKNEMKGYDTTFFRVQTLKDTKAGVEHKMESNVNFRVFKYFNLAPSVRYNETWYIKTLDKSWDATPQTAQTKEYAYNDDGVKVDSLIKTDTIAYGKLDTVYNTGFAALRTVDASLSLNTQLFGTLKFKRGYLRGVRHVAKIATSINYAPDYGSRPFGYFDSVQVVNTAGQLEKISYSKFEAGRGFLTQVPTGGEQFRLGYSINNIFEAKIKSKRDTIARKVKLFDNFNIGGSYNFAADSMKWSVVSGSGAVRLFKGLTTMNLSVAFDPYQYDAVARRRVNKLVIADSKVPVRFTGARASFNTSMTFGEIRELLRFDKDTSGDNSNKDQFGRRIAPLDGEYPEFLDLFNAFSINHTFSIDRIRDNGSDTLKFFNVVDMRGDIPLTEKWRFTVGNIGYDFVSKSLTYPDLGLYRDLHCWEMGVNWQPERGTYSFFIRVKPGSLDFLKVPYNKRRPDTFGF